MSKRKVPKLAQGEPTFSFEPDRKFGPAMTRLSLSRRLLVGAWVWGDYKTKEEIAGAAGYASRRAARDAFADPAVHAALTEEQNLYNATVGTRSIKRIERLQDSAVSEKVQLEAAKHLAGLAGFSPKQQVEVKHTHTLDDLSTEELNARIREFHDKLYPQIEAPVSTERIQNADTVGVIDAEFSEVRQPLDTENRIMTLDTENRIGSPEVKEAS